MYPLIVVRPARISPFPLWSHATASIPGGEVTMSIRMPSSRPKASGEFVLKPLLFHPSGGNKKQDHVHQEGDCPTRVSLQ